MVRIQVYDSYTQRICFYVMFATRISANTAAHLTIPLIHACIMCFSRKQVRNITIVYIQKFQISSNNFFNYLESIPFFDKNSLLGFNLTNMSHADYISAEMSFKTSETNGKNFFVKFKLMKLNNELMLFLFLLRNAFIYSRQK